VWRAHIVLLTADGCGTSEIMRRTGTSKTAVWRWQEQFMTDGVKGLLRDKTRPSRIPPLAAAVEESVVARTLADPPGETTHWTAAARSVASGSVRCSASGGGMVCGRIGCASSSCPTTGSSPVSIGVEY
jgi:Winged helix-turn helix